MRNITHLRSKILIAVPFVLVAVLAVHFTVTLAFLTPLNPVKLRVLSSVNWYMVPLFEQRWELFAPDPLVDTRYLLVACRVADAQGNIEERPYSNMTAAYRDLKQRYRLTPADRIERAQFAAIFLLFGERNAISKRVLEHADDDSPMYKRAREIINEEQQKRGLAGIRLLGRVASAECDRLYGRGLSREVRVRMATVKSPPFSKRQLPIEEGETKYLDFSWMPYEEVAPL